MTINPADILFAAGGYYLQKAVLARRYATPLHGGEEMKETHTCASTALYPDRDGTFRSAAIDGVRPGWLYSNADSATAVLAAWLEEQATNQALGSNVFVDSSRWSDSANFTITSRTSCIQGQTAYEHKYGGAGANWRSQTIGTFINGQTDCAYAILENVDATISEIAIWDNLAAAALVIGRLTWSTKVASISGGSGATGVIPLGNGRYLLWVTGTGTAAGTGANGNGRRAAIYPTGVASDTTHSAIIHHGQMETASSQPSSPIVTAGATVTRNRNVLSFPLYVAPNKNLCIYHRHIERDAPNFASQRLWQIGAAADSNPRLIGSKVSASDNYRATHVGTGAGVSSSVDVNPAFNSLIETRTIYTAATGVVQMGAAIALGTETLGSASGAETPGPLWSDTVIHINSVGVLTTGRQGWIATIVASWSGSAPSVDEFRALLT